MSHQSLHFDRVGTDAPHDVRHWLWALHGAFGSGRSWRSIVKRIVEQCDGWAGVLPDLREHGKSVGRRPHPHRFENAAHDLAALVVPTVVIGHSFGGKLAMQYIDIAPVALRQVWVIDSTPDVIDPETGDAWAMIKLLRQLPKVFSSREDAIDAMRRRGLSSPVATWMAMNVERFDEQYRWRFELDGLESLALDFYEADLWHVVERPPDDVTIHFVRASEGHMLTDAACKRLQAAGRDHGRVHLHDMRGGHWLNVDNPDALVELIVANLQHIH